MMTLYDRSPSPAAQAYLLGFLCHFALDSSCHGYVGQMEALGVQTIVYTDIATDGMLSGPSYDQLIALQKAVSCRIVASGGVTTLDDIKRLRDMGLYAAIIGKAYYAGTLDLAEAVKEAGPQC